MNLVERFCHEMQPLLQTKDSVHGAVQVCQSYAEAGRQVAELLHREGLRQVIAAARVELDPAIDALHTALRQLETSDATRQVVQIQRETPTQKMISDSSRTFREYAHFEAGIGGADVLIAESATIGLRMGPYESRALSLLPPTHIVIASTSKLVERVHDALESSFVHLNRETDPGSGRSAGTRTSPTLTLITGPSRTADIEKILVLPAHGPSKLYLWLVEEA
jgi:L-lactate utilization protein LutC